MRKSIFPVEAQRKDGKFVTWRHPGGKLRRLGPSSCTEPELLAIVLGTGSRGKSATTISQEILDTHGTLLNLMGIPLKHMMKVKGLKAVKATQLAAVFEIARRIVKHLEQQ